MANLTTNRGKYINLQGMYQGNAGPANLYVALCAPDTVPEVGTNTLGQLTEIPAGNGYASGGYILSRNDTDFPSVEQDDVNADAEVTMRDMVFAASGGPIPASGNGIAYVVLTDDNATVANRQILQTWDLSGEYTVSDAQSLTFRGGKIRNG